jgi:DNA mismatch repair protein MutS
MNGTDAAKARFIHRQTMANAMRFTTTELAGLETKIANAADRRWRSSSPSSTGWWPSR